MNFSTPNRFHSLLIVLLLTIIIDPLLADFTVLQICFDFSLSLILIVGCFAISRYKFTPWFAILLAIPLLLSIWGRPFGFDTPLLNLIGTISGIFYFALIAGTILSFVFTTKNVTWEVISAALIVYLLLGIMWGLGYNLVDLLIPGSFNSPDKLVEGVSSSYIYYSFMTITTVGYGDITPISGVARSVSMLEGIIGQIYMTVLVARLVGMHVAHSMKKS